MRIKVELIKGGIKVWESIHEAKQAGLHGLYKDGVPYLPDGSIVFESLPYAMRKAFYRNPAWWIRDSSSWYASNHLRSLRGEEIGMLIATLVD